MKHKLNDAYFEETKSKNKFRRIFDYLKKKIGSYFQLFEEFKLIMQAELVHVWEEEKQKNKEKISHLTETWIRGS